jgi:hypothetical protein
MTDEVQTRRRGPRRSAAQIRELLIEAGIAIVRTEGLASGAEHLTFKRVFSYLEARGVRLTHASVIRRVFDSQEAYQQAVLQTIAGSDSANLVAVGDRVIAEVLDGADLSTAELRFTCFLEICRVGGNATAEILGKDPMWKAWMGIWALAASGNPATTGAISSQMAANYARIDEEALVRYTDAMAFLGVKIRAPFDVTHFARAVSSLLEGCSLRGMVDPDAMAPFALPTGPGGAMQTWTPQSAAFVAIARSMFEPDFDWVADASN